MFGLFKKKIPHPDGINAYYTPGVVFDGGAEHLAYRNPDPHPIITRFAGFIPARNHRVTERQVVYQLNSLPIQPIIPGFVAGQYTAAPLTQNGSLPSNPNNDLLQKTLFGGVQ